MTGIKLIICYKVVDEISYCINIPPGYRYRFRLDELARRPIYGFIYFNGFCCALALLKKTNGAQNSTKESFLFIKYMA
jgi:hypothetical protein